MSQLYLLYHLLILTFTIRNQKMFRKALCFATLCLFINVGTTSDWTELKWWSTTSAIEFNPSTTVLENRFRDPVRYFANYFHIRNYLYSDKKYLGYMQVYYKYTNYKIESAWLRLSVEGVGSCKDEEVLGGELAETVSWDLTAPSVARVNGTAPANFQSCDIYPDWAALVNSGVINTARLFFYSSYKQAITADYRLVAREV